MNFGGKMRKNINHPAYEYDTLASIYDHSVPDPPGFINFYEEITEGDNSVLYIGCGTGRLLEKISKKARVCVGVDPSEKSIEIAKERLKGQANVDLIIDEIPVLKNITDKFDRVIIAGGGMEYMLTTRKQMDALIRLKDLCKSDGVIAFDVSAPPFMTSNPLGNYIGKLEKRDEYMHPFIKSSSVRFGYDHYRQLVRSKCRFEPIESDPIEVEYITRYTTISEWKLLLKLINLKLCLYGDFEWGEVQRNSSNYVFVTDRFRG